MPPLDGEVSFGHVLGLGWSSSGVPSGADAQSHWYELKSAAPAGELGISRTLLVPVLKVPEGAVRA